MKKTVTLALVLILSAALLTGCRNSGDPGSSATPKPTATATAQPSATPPVAPTTAPTIAPSPSQSPSDGGTAPQDSASPTGGLNASGLVSWDSSLGYSTRYDQATFRATETAGGDLFAAEPASGAVSLLVRRFVSLSADQLAELLTLLETGGVRESARLGEGDCPVNTVSAAEVRYDILDCGAFLLLFEARCPASDTAGQQALDSIRAAVRLSGQTALLQTLAELDAYLEPDSAGGSLRAAIYAGRILDWYVENRPELQQLADLAAGYCAAQSKEAASVFQDHLDNVYGAAVLLTEENGQDLLEASGYPARHFPWSENDAKTAFTALLNSAEEAAGG